MSQVDFSKTCRLFSSMRHKRCQVTKSKFKCPSILEFFLLLPSQATKFTSQKKKPVESITISEHSFNVVDPRKRNDLAKTEGKVQQV